MDESDYEIYDEDNDVNEEIIVQARAKVTNTC